jgi:hypothetical protein
VSSRRKADLTEDELISAIEHSELPTVLVEGKCDAYLLRKLESRLSDVGASLLPCGGRDMVLKLFLNRGRFKRNALAFLADQDMWVFTGIPAGFAGNPLLVLTSGYSIENDLCDHDFINRVIDSNPEREDFLRLIDVLCLWFAGEVDRAHRGEDPKCRLTAHQVLDDSRTKLRPEYLDRVGSVVPKSLHSIRGEFHRLLRGKTLIEAIHIVHSRPHRLSRWTPSFVVDALLMTKANTFSGLVERLRSALR